jgi:ubiquinone/menaquinone biosynthesis C-methylase UbiE
MTLQEGRPVRGVRDQALNWYRYWRLYIDPERLKMRQAIKMWLSSCSPESRVLEVGAGTSVLRPLIAREIPQVRYISGDIAPTNNTNLVLDANSLPIADASIDVFLALEVLEHISSPQRMLSEVSRVMKTDGLAIFTIPFMFGVHDFRDYYRYTPLGFAATLKECGLVVAETKQRGGAFVASTGLVRTWLLDNIVGKPTDWRAQGTRKQLLWLVATVMLTVWSPVTWGALGLDAVLDRESNSPPGYFFLCRKTST